MDKFDNIIVYILIHAIFTISYYFFFYNYNVDVEYYNEKYAGKETTSFSQEDIRDIYSILSRLKIFRFFTNILSIASLGMLVFIIIYTGVIIVK